MIFLIKGFRTIVFIFIVIYATFRPIYPPAFFWCLSMNFWDEAWWFLSLRVFGLVSSSLLLFPQRFGRYIHRPSSSVCRWIFRWSLMILSSSLLFPQRFGQYILRLSSGVCRNRDPRRNYPPFLNPRWGSPVLIPLTITGFENSFYCYSPAVGTEPENLQMIASLDCLFGNQRL